MKSDNTEVIRKRILNLIESEFDSDASFEREIGLKDKTVNNWRRQKSSSFMKMLPVLSERFKVNIGELMDLPLRKDTSELSEEEMQFLHLYRKSRTLPEKMRNALKETLETTINLYLLSYKEIKKSKRNSSSTKNKNE